MLCIHSYNLKIASVISKEYRNIEKGQIDHQKKMIAVNLHVHYFKT